MAEPTLPQDDQQPALFGPQEAPDSAPTEDDPRIHEPLTAREKDMLMLEQYWWKHRGAKEQAIRDRWDISATRYYQLQNRIIDKEAALAWDPITVKCLRRLRAQRQRSRSVRRLKISD